MHLTTGLGTVSIYWLTLERKPWRGNPSPANTTLWADLPVVPTVLPGGKSERNEFLLPDGKLTSAKILLEPAKPVLRISLKGA